MDKETLNIVVDLSVAYEKQIEQLQDMFEKGKAWLSDTKNASKPLLLHQFVKSQLNLIRRRLKRALAAQAEFESMYLSDKIHDSLEDGSDLIIDLQEAIKFRTKKGDLPEKDKELLKRSLAIWFREHKKSDHPLIQQLNERIKTLFETLKDIEVD
ncbi:MAG: hypothetical protein AAFV80_02835 [Bacteroidota bacterium]